VPGLGLEFLRELSITNATEQEDDKYGNKSNGMNPILDSY